METATCFYVMPSYAQAKKIIWDSITNDGMRILDYIPKEIIANKNNQEMKIRLTNGSLFQLIGSDNIDCFDEETEILTERGWLRFDCLYDTDKVASLENEKLTFVTPLQIVRYFHTGEMFRIKSKSMDALVTPNHRFYVFSPQGMPKFKYISDPTIRHDKILATSGWEGKDEVYFDFPKVVSEYACGKGRQVRKEYSRRVKMKKFVALLGIFLSDGSTFSNKKTYRITISQIKKEVREEIEELLNSMEIKFYKHKTGFNIEDKQLYFYFKQFGLQKDRYVPKEIKELCPEYLSELLKWLIKGDGHGSHYYTSSKRLADDVQEIAIKIGKSSVIRKKTQKVSSIKGRIIKCEDFIYDVSIKKSNYHYLQNSQGSYISKELYEGMVYCVSVPSGVIKVRRNGCEYFSGNSLMGTNPKIVVFSEYALQDPAAWEYIRPILKVNGGVAIFISTPRGKNHFWELCETAKSFEGWYYQRLSIEDTGVLNKLDIEQEISEGMTEELAMQEYYCSFDRGVEGSYYSKLISKMREEGRVGIVRYDPYKLVHTAWDLGWDDSTAIIFFQLINGNINIIDCEENSNKTLAWYKKLLTSKDYTYGTHLFPHDVEHVDGLGSGCTRRDILEDLQIPVTTVPRGAISDGIESVRAIISSRVSIDEVKCSTLLKSLDFYHKEWDEKKKIYQQKPFHDWSSHMADAMRYLATGLHLIGDGKGSVENDMKALNRFFGG